MKEYTVVGVMSGTSLDGLDLALCSFGMAKQKWNYRIIKTVTIPYPAEWKKKLSGSMQLTAREFVELDAEFGRYIGKQVKKFLIGVHVKTDLISSHGHTVFHEPQKGISKQIGHGPSIAAECRITTVFDFRSLDIAVGGQGAPLVPIGDEHLFGDYAYCLNLGGFSNISYTYKKKRIAYDICPVNIILNSVAERLGSEFDNAGKLGQKGKVHPVLLKELNNLPYYSMKPPKSLGKEWILEHFQPLQAKYPISEEDLLRTYYEHISDQIAAALSGKIKKKVLVTGGGAHNDFLINRLQSKTQHLLTLPDNGLVDYKEALIFAFLGLLRSREQINCNSTVTGGSFDTCCGSVQVML